MVKCLALQNQIYLILCYFRGTAMQRISLRQHQEECLGTKVWYGEMSCFTKCYFRGTAMQRISLHQHQEE